ncbi:tigger transposable element-derived protein 6-like [Argopecten irradians]|uniref:tigger transposable element-derived protein 6-like n=1 Tax=Argopecten irradians TaxID=31199 RepID=UPI00371CF988
MDNAPSHAIPKLSNVKVHFLPPTTTSHLQPLDAGIIQNFKSHYRKKQLAHLVDCIDKKEPPSLFLDTAVRFVNMAWNSVTPETIHKCWNHSGILPRDEPSAHAQTPETPDADLHNLLKKVQDELDLDPDLRLTVRQFVDLDKHLAPSEVVEEGEIVNSVTTNTSDDPDGDDDETDIYLAPPPSVAEARLAIDTVVNFLEHEKLTTESDIKKCFELQQLIQLVGQTKAKQTTINAFFGTKSSM